MAINDMRLAKRCHAKSKRSGLQCHGPAVRGKHVCRMHGARAGAPSGTANGLYKHGRCTCEAIEQRRVIGALLATVKETISGL